MPGCQFKIPKASFGPAEDQILKTPFVEYIQASAINLTQRPAFQVLTIPLGRFASVGVGPSDSLSMMIDRVKTMPTI